MSETSRDLASHAESLSAKVDVEIESIKINDLLESTNSEKKEAAAAAEELSLDEVTEASDLSNLSRRIWIVTTAALPWMTGTAVNPLLRALSLAEHRSKDTVTLMIPWLPSKDARAFLYGSCKQTFENPQEQEAWIRQYCIDRCNCTEQTAGNLRIQFWKGVYQESFASIFPLEDICSTIPRDEADICILEEPEHLNWFRVPAKPKGSKYTLETSIEPSIEVEDEGGNVVEISESCDLEESESGWNWNGASVIRDADIEILGWSLKFRHVVGILHTNYADYIRQYGMASVVTAPALNALSSLVVKAYCHKVIRLSATLPHLDATKEVTCNVHGVRHEFLQRPENPGEQQDVEESKVDEVEDNGEKLTLSSDTTPKLASVYFIGKLIWAKGFEHVLELEEKYKEAKGEYFSMDIYGGGKDEKDIKLAFFGRTGMSPSPSSVQLDAESSVPADAKAPDLKSVFGSSNSLRDQLSTGDGTVEDDYVVVGNTEQAESEKTTNIGSESLVLATSKTEDLAVSTSVNDTDRAAVDAAPNAAPLDVLGDLSGKTLSTTVDTADATMKLIESVMKAGINAISGGKEGTKGKDGGEAAVSPKMSLPFNIAPAKTRFKVC